MDRNPQEFDPLKTEQPYVYCAVLKTIINTNIP